MTVSSLELSGVRETLPVGFSQQVTLTAVYSDGRRTDVTQSVTFSGFDPAVIRHDGNGLFTAVAPGTTRVSASFGTVSAAANVRVTNAQLQRVELSPANPTLPLGVNQQFAATGIFDDGSSLDVTRQVNWSVSNPALARVSSTGLLQPILPGRLNVTAARGNVTASTQVTVGAAELLELRITPENSSVPVGLTVQYAVEGIFSGNLRINLSDQVDYSVTGPAEINPQGLLRALGVGQAQVTARFGNRTATANLQITTAVLQRIEVSPANTTVQGLKRYVTFNAVGHFSDGSSQNLNSNVVWSSESRAVATVSNGPGSEGTATSQGLGTTVVRATRLGVEGIARLHVTAPQPAEWTFRRGHPPLSSVAYGNGRYVAVGERGQVRVSLDQTDWVPQVMPVISDVNSVIFDGSRFVAVGSQGLIATSSDGVSWAVSRVSGSQNLIHVVFQNGLYVAVGGQGAVYTSADATSWQSRNSNTSATLTSVTFGTAGWVAIGDNGVVIHSANAIDWQVPPAPTAVTLQDVEFAAGLYVAVGASRTLSSPDGVNWTNRPNGLDGSAGLNAVTWDGQRFVALGERFSLSAPTPVLVSANGIDWTIVSAGNGRLWADVISTPQGLVAVGGQGQIGTSLDAITWEDRVAAGTSGLRAAAFGAGRYVVVGGSTLLVSQDAVLWEPRDPNTPFTLEAIAYGAGRFVAGGVSGRFTTSTDGEAWSPVFSGLDNMNDLIFAGGQFVLAGDSGMATSADGLTWVARASGRGNEGVAYGGGLYVAVGSNGIWTSPTGTSWSRVASVPGSFSSVTFGEGKFVALGTNSSVYVSTDGTAWTAYPTNAPVYASPVHLQTIAFGDGKFVLGGQRGVLMESDDGQTWTLINQTNRSDWYGVEFLNNVWVAVADWGTIYTSP